MSEITPAAPHEALPATAAPGAFGATGVLPLVGDHLPAGVLALARSASEACLIRFMTDGGPMNPSAATALEAAHRKIWRYLDLQFNPSGIERSRRISLAELLSGIDPIPSPDAQAALNIDIHVWAKVDAVRTEVLAPLARSCAGPGGLVAAPQVVQRGEFTGVRFCIADSVPVPGAQPAAKGSAEPVAGTLFTAIDLAIARIILGKAGGALEVENTGGQPAATVWFASGMAGVGGERQGGVKAPSEDGDPGEHRIDASDPHYVSALLTLGKSRNLKNAPSSLLGSVLAEANLMEAKTGDVLMREGDTDTDAIFMLVHGALDILVGGKHITTLVECGDLIGEVAPFSGRPRMAEVKASGDSLLIKLSHRRYSGFRTTNPERYAEFVGLILISLTEKIRALTDRVKAYEDVVVNESGKAHKQPEVEERLREIVLYSHVVQSNQDAVLITDPQGALAVLNPAARTLFGLPAGTLPPVDLLSLLPFMAPGFQRLLTGGVTALREEGTLPVAGGGALSVEVTASTVLMHGKLIGFAIMARDVSANRTLMRSLEESKEALAAYSRRLEAVVSERTGALRESNMNLTRANAQLTAETQEKDTALRKLQKTQSFLLQSEKMAALGQLAAGVAHEINNPMGFVYSNLHSIQEYFGVLTRTLHVYSALDPMSFPEGSEAAQCLAKIKQLKQAADFDYVMRDSNTVVADSLEGASRVVTIVKNLKEFSRVDSTQKEWANLNAGIDSTLKIIWNELKYKAEIEKDYGALGEIECYPQQLNQVFLNLLVNAGQAIEKFGKIAIRTWREDGGVGVEIKDTGSGIAPEHMGKIFDPFFTTKPAGKGTGLGLSVVYSIIRHHHGQIDVVSEVGKGTTFTIRLPARFPDTQPEVSA